MKSMVCLIIIALTFHFQITTRKKRLLLTGLSKWCGAGGWRFGAAFLYKNIEPEFKRALIGIGSETYSCAAAPVQIAAKTAYKNFSNMKDYLDYQIDILKNIGNFCSDHLNSQKIKVHDPQAGFYLFPDFSFHKEKLNHRGIMTSNQLCERLLIETGVMLLPATTFSFEADNLVARLAYVNIKEPKEKHPFNITYDGANIVEGIKKIVHWIEKG